MRLLSTTDWPTPYACTYEVWSYGYHLSPPLHQQDYYEVFWIEDGDAAHVLSNQRIKAPQGYLALIRPEDAHGFSAWAANTSMALLNFAFPTHIWYKIRDSFFPAEVCFFDHLDIRKREYRLETDERERIRQMGLDLAAGRWTETNAAAFLLGILTLLANRDSYTTKDPQAPDWLNRALRLIESWPHFVGGVPEFVKLAGRSHEHVSRSCRLHINKSPRELVNQARLRWASMQLETTDKEIIEIAHECGFENLGHFYKLFRTAYHFTPRRYRQKFGIPLGP